jgi:hypothetical protein
MTDDARALLRHARHLLERGLPGQPGIWPRACALLARQALEDALASYWEATSHPSLQEATARSQLICLRELAGIEIAAPVAASWLGLSNACHLHAYELAPTAGEVARWLGAIDGFVEHVESAAGGRHPST